MTRLDPASLGVRCKALQPDVTDDGMGGASTTYAVVRSFWGRTVLNDPSVEGRSPVHDTRARGVLTARIGHLPPQGWRVEIEGRVFSIEAMKRGTRTDPFDSATILEVAP